MKTLVLNIDRDDDFGRKTKIISPIIGINDNVEAANKLGQADPEDSDLNAIFSAISIYKNLISQKKDTEIATICGHINVGIKSDEIITKQLDDVITKTKVDNVILVTDGAEDEFVLPIIQSRIKILSINRITVKQSKELEDTYYRLIKLLDDEKVQKQFILPIALVLIVWAFFVLIGMTTGGFGAILLTLGIYLIIRVYKLERNLFLGLRDLKTGFLTGRLSIFTNIIALAILIANGIMAYYNVINTTFKPDVVALPTLYFIFNIIWGIVIAGLIITCGRVIDTYVREKKKPWYYWGIPFSLFAFGFISSAVIEALYKALINWPDKFDINPFLTINFIGYTLTGVIILIIGTITHHYIKEIYTTEEKEIEIEQQTTKIAEDY